MVYYHSRHYLIIYAQRLAIAGQPASMRGYASLKNPATGVENMYCPQCAHYIEEGEPVCTYCGCELEPKRKRIRARTIVIIFAVLALAAAIAFFSLKILDFAQNPVPRDPPAQPALEQPEAPTGPPEFPAGLENMQPGPESATARVYAAGGLRMRTGPGVDYDIVLVIPSYEFITIFEEEGGWARAEHSGASGWVSTDFLLREGDPRFLEEPQEAVVTPGARNPNPATARINTERGLRMRMGPGVDYHVVIVIPDEEIVLTHDESDGWIYIEYQGLWGWVDGAFLLDEPGE